MRRHVPERPVAPTRLAGPARRRGRALAGVGAVLPAALLAAMLTASPAFADVSVSTKTALTSAFQGATSSASTITLTANLTAAGDTDDVQVLSGNKVVTLDLAGHDLVLDEIALSGSSNLTITDSARGASNKLLLGGVVLTPGDPTGIKMLGSSALTIDRAKVVSTGSGGLPGIGAVSSSASGTVTVTNGASVTATGGTGASGIGCSANAAPVAVTVNSATVVATGSAGAAGIGGGQGSGGGTVALAGTADVTASDGGLTSDAASGTAAPSAIGAGQGTTALGSLSISANSTLHIPANRTLRVPAQTAVTNSGTIDLQGTLTGGGYVTNDGSIVLGPAGAVNSSLVVTNHNTAVNFTLQGGTGGSSNTRVYASTMTAGGVPLTSPTPPSGKLFIRWETTVSGTTSAFTATTALASVAQSGTVTVNALYKNAIQFSKNALNPATTGTAYSDTLGVTGDDISSYALTSGALPGGLSMDTGTGAITGTATAAFNGSFTVTVTSSYATASHAFTLASGDAPAITTNSPLSSGVVGTQYTLTLAASGTGTKVWSVLSGTLPAGLTLSSGGVLSGTPTAGGTANFTVGVSSTFGTAPSRSYTQVIYLPPTFATTSLQPAPTTVAWSQQLQATGDSQITFALVSGSTLPGFLTLSSSGLLSGTPTRATTATFTVRASSQYGHADQQLTFTSGAAPAISMTTVPDAAVGRAYSAQLTASGDGALTYTASNLPAGLALSTGGVLTGPIQVSGTNSFTVTVSSPFGTASTSIAIASGNAPTIGNTATLPGAPVGQFYSTTVTAPGDGAATFAVTSGSLPSGLSLDGVSGIISGTPTASGSGTFTVRAQNRWGSDAKALTVVSGVAPAVTSTSVPDATVGVSYSSQLTATGDGTVTFAATGLPAGLTLSTGGLLSGQVTAGGTSSITVTATSAWGSATATLALTAGAPPVVVSTSLALATVGAPYSDAVTATGDGAKSFTVTGGALPAGLSLDPGSGALTGATTAVGSATFTVSVHSRWGDTSQAFTLTSGTLPSTLPGDLAVLTVGQPSSQTITAATGTGPITYTASSLPAGLVLDPDGTLHGTATAAVSTGITVTATNAFGSTVVPYVVVAGTAPSITTTAVGDAVVGRGYRAVLAAAGSGTAAFALQAGTLPDGISLAGDGTLSGTPTAGGTSSFTVRASTAFGSADQQLTLFTAIAPAFTTASLPYALTGASYVAPIATAGTGPVVLAPAGPLPVGLSFDAAAGALYGSLPVSGTTFVTLTASSAYGSAQQTFRLVTVVPPTLATVGLADGTAGVGYRTSVAVTGDGAIAYAVSSGSLPDGMALDAASGALSGTPTVVGTATFTVVASSPYGSASRVFSLRVLPAVVASAPASVPAPPVLPRTGPTSGRLGHRFQLSIAANSTVDVRYAITAGALPAGLTLNANTGLISGTPRTHGRFTVSVLATSSAGATTATYTIAVPDVRELLTASAGAATVRTGSSVRIAVHGLTSREGYSITLDGHLVHRGTGSSLGSAAWSVTLPVSRRDTRHTLRVTGATKVADPAVRNSTQVVVTAVTLKKHLGVRRIGRQILVTKLAAGEPVSISIGGRVVGRGRADQHGLFTCTPKGSHTTRVLVTATGALHGRTGSTGHVGG